VKEKKITSSHERNLEGKKKQNQQEELKKKRGEKNSRVERV
jgi:hypothetical protein